MFNTDVYMIKLQCLPNTFEAVKTVNDKVQEGMFKEHLDTLQKYCIVYSDEWEHILTKQCCK